MRLGTVMHLAAALAVLGASGCAEVKQAVTSAGEAMDSVFLGDAAKSAPDQAPTATKADETARQAARLHLDGLAARKRGDEAAAFRAFGEAARLGHGPAAYELGRAYTDGIGTEVDAKAGDEWFRTAAERGEPRAQFVLGAAYYGGVGVPQDYETAVGYLSQAAASGHGQAQYLLGEAYSNGRGVAKNPTWAARWYGKAAEQGIAEAQYAFGVVHATGLGLPINRAVGYGWLALAVRGGHEKADVVRRAIATRLSAKEIRRAEAWAGRFQVRAQPPLADPPTVMYVQQALNTLGYDAGPVDGQSGPKTRAAVSKYQKKSGLQRNGHISEDLLDRLLADQGTTS